ncbi:MAG: cell division ATP-binding protein FtsE [Cyanobacteria bacterium J06597_16]
MISILPRKPKQPDTSAGLQAKAAPFQGDPSAAGLSDQIARAIAQQAVVDQAQAAQQTAQHIANQTSQQAAQQAEKTAPMIAFNRVSKAYSNGAPALLDINLALNKGDFLFITGPSGAGKSTLLKLLYGQEKPTEGSVCINGQDITQLKGNRLAMLRRRIGVVFQDYKLIPSRTVAENVAFVLHAQGYSRKEINRRLPVTLKMVGLQDKADRFPSQLSGGEQQRASIARAVVGTPPLLLADEPTGNLDGDNARQVINILRKLNSIGITVVVTTHDEAMVRQLSYPVVQIRSHRLYNFR